MRRLNWNINYHTAHHIYPNVPFHQLPELHREIEAKVGFELPSAPYLALHWRHLKTMLAGGTEFDICAEEDRRIAPLLQRVRRRFDVA